MNTPSSDDEDDMLSTIQEVDSESLDSNHLDTKTTSKSANGLPLSHQDAEKKKKKKKSKQHHREDNSHVLETSQQILVDLCNEMKSLQSSIQASTNQATSAMEKNVSSNTTMLHQIQTEVDLLKQNLLQIDSTIQSRATPEQISELGKIRAIQTLLADAAADKERTVQLYEVHARRGYEEIERLRSDLEMERGENVKLRQEIDQIRGGGGTIIGPLNPLKNEMYSGPAMYINGGDNLKPSADGNETIGTFDDMTLDTKQTAENTVAFETKSLKKRIIHMKKKLQVAQLEAKEASSLRSELESMRLKMEGMRKEGLEKDRLIQRLREDLEGLRKGRVVASNTAADSTVNTHVSSTARSVTVTTTKKKGPNRWWNGL